MCLQNKLICFKQIKVSPSNKAKNNYCSRKCSDVGRRTKKLVACNFCGKKNWRIPYHCNKSKKAYCDINCYNKSKKGDKDGRMLKARIVAQNMKGPTSIEVKLYKFLKSQKIAFIPQKLINNKFLVDAFVLDKNLVIEADGDYWHGLDKVKKRDKSKNAYLTKCGFNMLRLSEREIHNGLYKSKVMSWF